MHLCVYFVCRCLFCLCNISGLALFTGSLVLVEISGTHHYFKEDVIFSSVLEYISLILYGHSLVLLSFHFSIYGDLRRTVLFRSCVAIWKCIVFS